MARIHRFSKCALRSCGIALVASIVLATAPGSSLGAGDGVHLWRISYRAWNGSDRPAYVLLPAWYGPQRNPPIPLVISPHGRGGTGEANARFWGNLPAVGRFAVINPDGMGRRFERFSYGYAGQIEDLARMPELASAALPWLHIDRSRVFALGTSMGGQETLLLVARHPRLLAAAAAMDSVTDLVRRYRQLPEVPCDPACLERYGEPFGRVLQATLRREVGGTPEARPVAYAARSAQSQVRRIASSGVPLQLWWSSGDQIVFDQEHQSARLARDLWRLGTCGPVVSFAGTWRHSQAMWAGSLLPVALAGFGLLPRGFPGIPDGGYVGACVPTADLSGIPRLIATGLECRSTPGSACT
jgi:pimeloyl-ACP methyl ester carboxylesterase